MVRRVVAVVVGGALVLAGAGCSGGGGERVTVDWSSGPCQRVWGAETLIGRLPDGTKEVSGFVTSPSRPGVAWMVRDSENPPTLYSFAFVDGRVRTAEFPVAGATNGDWEDIAYTRDTDGRGRLWILDNRSKKTSPKRIWEVEEPNPADPATIPLAGAYTWEYPDHGGNYDTETLFALRGVLFVVTKSETNRVYRFDGPLSRTGINRPTWVGDLTPGTRYVFASSTDDDRLLATASTRQDTVWIHEANGVLPLARQTAVFERKMDPAQREAGDFFPTGGCDLVLISEDRRVWRLANQSSGGD